jgi:hypothetical protein
VLVALLSHFGPGKFPANWRMVAYCVLGYLLLNAVLAIFCAIKEGDSFLTTHPKLVRALLFIFKHASAGVSQQLRPLFIFPVAYQNQLASLSFSPTPSFNNSS